MKNEEIKKLNILNGINFMKSAWSSVTQETIKNCFKHAFFDDPKTAPEIDFTEEWNKLKQITTISYMTFNDYLNIDAHALPYKQMNEDEIVELVK